MRATVRWMVAGLVLGSVVVVAPGPAYAHSFDTTTLVSRTRSGAAGNSVSTEPAVSNTGRFVAFSSFASDLVPGDTNGAEDVFIRDVARGTTRRVSVGTHGQQGDGPSLQPAVSADGRFVAFASEATNLVPGDTNSAADIFVRDLWHRTTVRVSVGPHGRQGNGTSVFPSISGDGSRVVFTSGARNLVPGDTNSLGDVFLRDLATGTTRRVNVGSGGQSNGATLFPVISANGRYVAFESGATTMVPGDTNDDSDIFVRDLLTGALRRINLGPGGVQADGTSSHASLSRTGRFVAYSSFAGNLVPGDANTTSDVFVFDQATGATRLVSRDSAGQQSAEISFAPAISADGRRVAFICRGPLVPGDTNLVDDVYLRDLAGGSTVRMSVSASGGQADNGAGTPAVAGDGGTVAFVAVDPLTAGDANNAEDVYVRR